LDIDHLLLALFAYMCKDYYDYEVRKLSTWISRTHRRSYAKAQTFTLLVSS